MMIFSHCTNLLNLKIHFLRTFCNIINDQNFIRLSNRMLGILYSMQRLLYILNIYYSFIGMFSYILVIQMLRL
jgi:hypothetical protein